MTSFNWSGAASGAGQGAAAGAPAGPWGALAGGVAGGLIGGFTPDGNSLKDYRDALDDQYQRQQRHFKWLQGRGLHPLSIVGGGAGGFSPTGSLSRTGTGNVNLDGFARAAEGLSQRRYERSRQATANRLARAEISEREAAARNQDAQARLYNERAIQTATSRSTLGRLNSNQEGVLGLAPMTEAPGMGAEQFEERYGDLAAEVVGMGNLVRDMWWSRNTSPPKRTARGKQLRWGPRSKETFRETIRRKTRERKRRYEQSPFYGYWKDRRNPAASQWK